MRRLALCLPLLALTAAIAAMPAAGAQARSNVCRIPNVNGMSAQAARNMLKAFGCTGTIYRNTRCVPDTGKFIPFIGRVVAQQPAPGPRARPSNTKVTLTVDVRESAACKTLNPPKQPPGFADLDGNWTATFTVQQSQNPLMKQGQQLTGITFTVKGGVISGMLSGTISSTTQPSPSGIAGAVVYPANVNATLDGVSCQGTVNFWFNNDIPQAADESPIVCNDGQNQILGLLTAGQN